MRRIRFLGVVPVLAATLVLASPLQASSSVVPAIAVPVSHPAAAPVAGEQFAITFPVSDALTGARAPNVSSLSFEPTIAGKPVLLQQTSFVAGVRAVAG